MKALFIIFPLLALGVVTVSAEAPACSCCVVSTTASTDKPVSHPIKGVIVEVLADRSALLVKHEEIPGFMKAMTMMLKVDADTLKTVAKGQTITGILTKKADGWWLTDVTPAKE